MVKRYLEEKIREKLFKKKVIIIFGARQVGKTTLVKNILKEFQEDGEYLNCDEPDIRRNLTDKTSTELKAFIGNKKLVVIDEAQRVKNIGLTLKLLHDNFPEIQIIATGSSSFDLSNEIVEPLTGRKYEFHLYPFSMKELMTYYSNKDAMRIIERRVIFGMYPDVVLNEGSLAEEIIKNIANSYLYKDILAFQSVKNSEILDKLLQLLALQLGQEVSYTEISQSLGIDKNTVANYVEILEKAFIIFRLPPFSRNIRNELKKLRKIYFYDNGIRNALINNFNMPELRNDIGGLWENFMINERMKWNQQRALSYNSYFWRTHSQQEIDYLEESGGKIEAFEFKWKKNRCIAPKVFMETYENSTFRCVSRENFEEIYV